MAWDSTRPVPWRRLLREWAIYGTILVVVILVVRRNDLKAAQFVWLVLSFPVYVGFGAILAKFGYQRKTLKDLRAETARRTAEQQAMQATAPSSTGRAKPAPTKRTSTGPSNRPKSRSGKSKRR